jgi:hypothetical protein
MMPLDPYRKYLYALLAASLPFPLLISNIAIAFVILHWFFTYAREVKFKLLLGTPLVYFIAYYLWHVISLTYSENLAVGLFDLEKNFGLLIIPLIVFTSRKIEEEELFLILKAFILSTGLALGIILLGF